MSFTGVDCEAPRCPRCGRRIARFRAFSMLMTPRHKDPKTGRWCREVRS